MSKYLQLVQSFILCAGWQRIHKSRPFCTQTKSHPPGSSPHLQDGLVLFSSSSTSFRHFCILRAFLFKSLLSQKQRDSFSCRLIFLFKFHFSGLFHYYNMRLFVNGQLPVYKWPVPGRKTSVHIQSLRFPVTWPYPHEGQKYIPKVPSCFL